MVLYENYTGIIWDFSNQENSMPWLGCGVDGRSQELDSPLKKQKPKKTSKEVS